MLPQDMKRCSVCTLKKSDRHFIRKERIFKTCNECSEYCKMRRKLDKKRNIDDKSDSQEKDVVEPTPEPTPEPFSKPTPEPIVGRPHRINSKCIKYVK